MTVQVGLIGLGAMGLGMAQSLRRAGHTVHVYDVRAEAAQAFAKDGGVVAASPAALGAACDVVVSVVVGRVVFGAWVVGAVGGTRGVCVSLSRASATTSDHVNVVPCSVTLVFRTASKSCCIG